MIKSKNRLKKTIVGMITFVLAFFLLPFQGLFAAPQEIKDDTDLSALSLYQFQLTTDNMSVVSKSSAVQQYHMDAPGFGDLQHKYPGYPMENFTLKVDKTKKEDQTFDKPLSLKFANAGTVNGKQVDAYLTINKVTLHYINNSEAPAQMADVNKKTVNFFNVSNLWGANQFEIGNIAYVDEAHDDVMKNTFTVDADITAELKYSDGSEPDMKLVMKPTDIDANGLWNTKEAFYVTNYNTSVDKRVMNNRNNLEAVQEGDKTVWNAGPGGGTSGAEAENNISGLALRSVNNTMNFGYRSANYASATFSLYMEQVQFAPEKEVDPAQIPAQAGEAVTYKTLFKIPKPGKEIIAALSSLDFVDTFDDRLDFKDLTVDADGVVLAKDTDYTVEKSGQKVTVKMAAAYLNKDKAGTPIRITYNTVTNNKVGDKASGPIENIVAMQPDNLYFASNKVTTTLLYNKIHEFESGTPGKTLPQEVTNLLPAKVSGLANGTTVNPTQPTTTKVSVPEGNWVFKGYDKVSEVVENGDVKFIGKWEFTPAPTYKATHEFVSGTSGKELPQEVKSLLPADQTDLKDGSQATPTQPSQTEVKTAEGTWSFKSYDKASETINGADAHFVGTWEFTPAPTYKATHEFVSGTPGKELPQEVKSLLPADQTDLKDGSQATPTQPSKTEVKTTEGTWSFKSYDKASETINGADAHFIGTWEFTPAPTYKATHEFVSGTPGKELPQEVKDLLPVDQTDLKDGSQATPTQPSKTEVKTAEGTWSFKSYDKASETINGADAHFIGTWEFTPAPTYKATHEFVSGTPGKELPQEVKDLLPVDQTDLKDGSQATPTQPSKTEVKTAEGTWSFKSYDKASETINGADAHFIGTWEFTPAPTYKATHEFVSGTPGKELPQEVKDLLPVDQTDLKDGSQATPTQPSKTEVKTAEGTWSFKSYDKASETINGADAHFVGTWEFTPAPTVTHKAVHEFVSGTPGKELPQEVKTLLPADQTDLKDGSKVTPTQPSQTEVKTAEGTWSFKSYDKTSETVNGSDVKFVGTWEFTASPAPTVTHKAVHEFVSGTPGKELPQEVKTLLPADQTDLKDGSKVTPTQPSQTEVKTAEGTWSFKSYDKTSETVNGSDVKFVGTWEFTASPAPTVTHKAVHEFVSGTPGKELPQEVKTLLPADQTDLKDGSKVTPTQPSQTEVKTAEGTWSFKSYDKTSETVNGSDVKFVGTWEFTASPAPTVTHKAVHEFVSGTPGKELPQEVKTLLPADQTDLKDGSKVTPTQPSQTEVKTAEGTWSFKSYDKASETINGADVKFTGTWEFTPAPTVRPITSFVDTKGNTLIPSEDGEQPKKDIPGYRFVETKKLPNGDTEHVYEKVKTSHKDKEGNDIPGYPSEDGEQPKKDIPGYRFVETKKLPNGDIEHVYEKVKTSHKDKEGNDIPGYPSEDGEQPKKDIPGYRFVETKKLPNGDIEHVYEKVKTSHKDKEGNDIPGYPSEDGEQPKKDIPGYRFVETKKLPNGDTEHVYEKVKTSHKDKEGNDIPGYPSENGEQPKKDIPGYRFVETKKLPNGDTEHVYEKVVTAPQQKPTKATKELPNTGTEDHSSLAALGLLGVLSGFGLVARKKKED